MLWRAAASVGLGLVLWCAGSSATWAADTTADSARDSLAAGDVVVVPAGRTIDRDYFAVAERIEIAGTINGDAHVLARHIVISGTINGDLLASGATVEVPGTVAHNARILAGRATIGGQIGRNLTVTAATLIVSPQATISGAFVGGGSTVRIHAPIARNLTIAGRDVTLGGSVGGNVNAAVAQLTIDSTAHIAGPISYLGDTAPTIHPQAQVGGPVTPRRFATLHVPGTDDVETIWPWIGIGLLFISALSTLLAGLALLIIFPRAMDRSVSQLQERALGAGGLGLLLCLAAPFALVLLLLTLVGIPLAVVLGALFLVILYLGRIVAMTWVGRLLLAGRAQPVGARLAFLLGLVVYYGLRLIPIVGGFVGLAATCLGLGAIARAAFADDPPEDQAASSSRFLAQDF